MRSNKPQNIHITSGNWARKQNSIHACLVLVLVICAVIFRLGFIFSASESLKLRKGKRYSGGRGRRSHRWGNRAGVEWGERFLLISAWILHCNLKSSVKTEWSIWSSFPFIMNKLLSLNFLAHHRNMFKEDWDRRRANLCIGLKVQHRRKKTHPLATFSISNLILTEI